MISCRLTIPAAFQPYEFGEMNEAGFRELQGKVGRAVVENADFLPAPSDWTRRDVRPQAPK